MKIVVTHIISGDLWAGAEAQVFQLLAGLQANRQITPTAVVFNPGILHDRLQALGIHVDIADEGSLSPLGQILAIRSHLKEHGTDIVHTHGFKENVLGTIAQHLARVPKSLRTAHGNPEIALTWKKPTKKLTQILDDCVARFGQNAVVAVSRQLESTLSDKYPGKTVRISNFISLPSPDIHTSENTPSSRDFKPPYRLGLIGRAVPVKRLDLFIETVNLLATQSDLDITGTIYGDGPLLGAMKDYARNVAGGRIEFRGFVDDIPLELAKLDALLMPSDHEGLPMTLLEALAAGTPVIAHNTGGIPEVLNGGACGMLVDDHSARGYAAAVTALLKDNEKAQAVSKAARQHVTNEFSAVVNIQKYQDLYATLYEGQPARLAPLDNQGKSDSL